MAKNEAIIRYLCVGSYRGFLGDYNGLDFLRYRIANEADLVPLFDPSGLDLQGSERI